MPANTLNPMYAPLFEGGASRYVLLWGGRGRGGSFAASTYAVSLLTGAQPARVFTMREVFKDIRTSIYQDIRDRIDENGCEGIKVNDVRMTFKSASGNIIFARGFKASASGQVSKQKSLAKASHIIVEEADEISGAAFMKLDDTLRRRDINIKIVLIFNATHIRHWLVKRFLSPRPAHVQGFFSAEVKRGVNALSIHGTYHDNRDNINNDTAALYEGYATSDPRHYYMEVMGFLGETVSGRVFDYYTVIKPDEYDEVKGRTTMGLDIGFADPNALVEVKRVGKKRYVKVLLYQTGMSDEDMGAFMKKAQISRFRPIYTDPEAPKERMFLRRKGYNAIKAFNPVRRGLKVMKAADIYIVDDEAGGKLLDELEQYAVHPTTGNLVGDHHAIDAWRYAVASEDR